MFMVASSTLQPSINEPPAVTKAASPSTAVITTPDAAIVATNAGKIRGFKPNGIGPRDMTNGGRISDALGGNLYAVARFEADFPPVDLGHHQPAREVRRQQPHDVQRDDRDQTGDQAGGHQVGHRVDGHGLHRVDLFGDPDGVSQ